MKSCVFCQIVAGKIPAYKVYEDGEYVAFLDIKPYAKGQVLVIPKAHFRWVDDSEDFGGFFERAKAVGLGVRKALKPWTIFYITHGIEMEHAHIKVIPRYKDDAGEALRYIQVPSGDEMETMRTKITKSVGEVCVPCNCDCGGKCDCKGGVLK